MIKAEPTCQDFGDRPGCLGTPDPKYTMDFSDIGEEPIYFCTHCGPEAHAISAILMNAMQTVPGFTEKFASELDKARAEMDKKVS